MHRLLIILVSACLVFCGGCTALICPVVSLACSGAALVIIMNRGDDSKIAYSQAMSDFDKASYTAIDSTLKRIMNTKYISTSELVVSVQNGTTKDGTASIKSISESNKLDYIITPRLFYSMSGGGLHPIPALVTEWKVLNADMKEQCNIKTTVFYEKNDDGAAPPTISNSTMDPANSRLYAELAGRSAEDFWAMWNGASPIHSKDIVR